MAPLKPFLQVYPGQNDPNLQPRRGKNVDPKEWERKQRLKEYRIAARREKRNRKSDEKKQRKLNATILRRMTRNPVKYNKNAGRNRIRAIEQERRKIQNNAIHLVQRIAAVYDPSGQIFNVKPVTTLEDGRVVTLESIERKKEREAEKQQEREQKEQEEKMKVEDPTPGLIAETGAGADRLNPERMKMLSESKMNEGKRLQGGKSKTQLKKEAQWAPRDPPQKPVVPDGIDLPSDEEENWLELWDLPDNELERRVLREKKKKARARKELRVKQKEGKAERRAARDEKRRVYREIKQSWKILREEERRRRKFLQAMEDEEGKRLAEDVTKMHREFAMELCAELGFTLENVEGVNEIQPKALGMKGTQVDFDKLEVVGEGPAALKHKEEGEQQKPRGNRVNLGAIADEKYAENVYRGAGDSQDEDMNANFVELGTEGPGQDHEPLNFNHKTRRKLRRAIETAQIQREQLVRDAAIKHCEENGIHVHPALKTSMKPINAKGSRTNEDGTLETGKHERVRSRVELTEFNRQAKVLRRQAKEMAVEAGIRIYLELMGRIPRREGLDELVEARARAKMQNNTLEPLKPKEEDETWAGADGGPIGGIWPAQSQAGMTAAEILESWPIPEDPMERYMGTSKWREDAAEGAALGKRDMGSDEEEETSEDSAARQLKAESGMPSVDVYNAKGRRQHATSGGLKSGSTSSKESPGSPNGEEGSSEDSGSDSDPDTDMSDAS